MGVLKRRLSAIPRAAYLVALAADALGVLLPNQVARLCCFAAALALLLGGAVVVLWVLARTPKPPTVVPGQDQLAVIARSRPDPSRGRLHLN